MKDSGVKKGIFKMLFGPKDLGKMILKRNELSHPFNCQFDSKDIAKGDLFFALKGDKVDGHNFLKEVADKGAFGAVVESGYKGKDFGLTLYKVDDVLETLQHLAKKAIDKKSGKIIAITGSVGKTTTKEFVNTLLEKRFSVSRNPRSFNSQRGLPLSVLNMPDKQDVILLEMGMSVKGEMEKLADIVKPEIALFTPIGLVHAGNFEDIEEIVEQKALMRSKKKTKITIAPHSLLQYGDVFSRNKTITYSIKSTDADYYLFVQGDKIFIKGKNEGVFPKIFEESHLLENFLGAFAVAKELGMENKEIEERTSFLSAVPMRFEKIYKKGVLFIQDCYNANSLSTTAALENLPSCLGKKIAVLGAMGELGKFSRMSHEIVGEVAAKNVDILLCLGPECKHMIEAFKSHYKNGMSAKDKKPLRENCFYFDNMSGLIQKLKEIVKKDDLVLIKGSRFLQMEKILASKEFD